MSVDCDIQRRGHSTTPLPDGRLLVLGGFGVQDSSKHSKENPRCPQIHSRLAHPLIISLFEGFKITTLPSNLPTPSARLYHTASLMRREDQSYWILIFGGRLSPEVPLADAYTFDCKTFDWNPVIQSTKAGIWPSPRFRHASSSIQIGDSSHVFIHGGIGPAGVVLTDSWLFDSNRLQWIRLSGLDELIGPRHSHQIYYDSHDSQMYVFGGLTVISDGLPTHRIANNVQFDLAFEKDLSVQRQSGLFEFPDSKFKAALINRYSHQVAEWDGKTKKLLMSGGISKKGQITTENQYVLLDLQSKTCAILQPSRSIPRIMVGHTMHVITKKKECQTPSKLAVVVGGGATCFSFGSSFDKSIQLLADWELNSLQTVKPSNLDEERLSRKLPGTFDPSPGDSWGRVEHVRRIENLTKESWQEVLSNAQPVLLNTQGEVGNCLELWTPEYLKQNCGAKKCSVHLSHQNSSATLQWHDKNFKYYTMSFKELIDQTIETQNSTGNRIVYLRSLSDSPKQVSNFHLDFPEISRDFKVPQVIHDYIDQDRFFSSVLRISGADMGLWAHYDTYDNILIQIKGQKLVRLWHPREIINLYVEGSSSHIPNFESPDLDRFPLYRKCHPTICILKPGDTLFIPAHWIHSVQTIEPSISINTFFKTERLESFYSSKRDIWGNLDLSPYQELHDRFIKRLMVTDPHDATLQDHKKKMESTTQTNDQEAFETFNRLPTPQRQFYLKKLAADIVRFADRLDD